MLNYFQTIDIINEDLLLIDEKIKTIILYRKNFLSQNFLDFILTHSKKIRSAITILTLKADNISISDDIISLCALIELVHNASLIHDDVIDKSDYRRNSMSFNKIFDDKTAVIAGDFLLSLIMNEIVKINNPNITNTFIKTMLSLCEGEINQIQNKNALISIDEYIKKSEQKTADLFKCSLICSFLTVNKENMLGFAENFAKNFGIAFQIKDDLDNFISESKEKPLENDFLNGIYTAPLIFYLEDYPCEVINSEIIHKVKNSNAIVKTEKLYTYFSDNAIDLLGYFSDNQYKKALLNLCKMFNKGIHNEIK